MGQRITGAYHFASWQRLFSRVQSSVFNLVPSPTLLSFIGPSDFLLAPAQTLVGFCSTSGNLHLLLWCPRFFFQHGPARTSTVPFLEVCVDFLALLTSFFSPLIALLDLYATSFFQLAVTGAFVADSAYTWSERDEGTPLEPIDSTQPSTVQRETCVSSSVRTPVINKTSGKKDTAGWPLLLPEKPSSAVPPLETETGREEVFSSATLKLDTGPDQIAEKAEAEMHLSMFEASFPSSRSSKTSSSVLVASPFSCSLGGDPPRKPLSGQASFLSSSSSSSQSNIREVTDTLTCSSASSPRLFPRGSTRQSSLGFACALIFFRRHVEELYQHLARRAVILLLLGCCSSLSSAPFSSRYSSLFPPSPVVDLWDAKPKQKDSCSSSLTSSQKATTKTEEDTSCLIHSKRQRRCGRAQAHTRELQMDPLLHARLTSLEAKQRRNEEYAKTRRKKNGANEEDGQERRSQKVPQELESSPDLQKGGREVSTLAMKTDSRALCGERGVEAGVLSFSSTSTEEGGETTQDDRGKISSTEARTSTQAAAGVLCTALGPELLLLEEGWDILTKQFVGDTLPKLQEVFTLLFHQVTNGGCFETKAFAYRSGDAAGCQPEGSEGVRRECAVHTARGAWEESEEMDEDLVSDKERLLRGRGLPGEERNHSDCTSVSIDQGRRRREERDDFADARMSSDTPPEEQPKETGGYGNVDTRSFSPSRSSYHPWRGSLYDVVLHSQISDSLPPFCSSCASDSTPSPSPVKFARGAPSSVCLSRLLILPSVLISEVPGGFSAGPKGCGDLASSCQRIDAKKANEDLLSGVKALNQKMLPSWEKNEVSSDFRRDSKDDLLHQINQHGTRHGGRRGRSEEKDEDK